MEIGGFNDLNMRDIGGEASVGSGYLRATSVAVTLIAPGQVRAYLYSTSPSSLQAPAAAAGLTRATAAPTARNRRAKRVIVPMRCDGEVGCDGEVKGCCAAGDW